MLKYVGDGSYLADVPARNLSDQDIKDMEAKFGWRNLKKTLIASGIYVEEAADHKKEKANGS